eukprot:gene9182-16317_t
MCQVLKTIKRMGGDKELVCDIAWPFGKPVSAILILCKWGIESLEASKANIKVTELLKARVSSIASILNLTKEILKEAKEDAAVHAHLKPALESTVTALHTVATEATKWGSQKKGYLQLQFQAKQIKDALVSMHQQLTNALTDLDVVLTICNRQMQQGMLLKNDPDSRKLLRNSNMTPEQIKAVYAAAVQKSNMWLDKHFILVQDELDISFDQAPLGEGGTAKVYSAMYKGQKVAVKVPHIRTGVAGVQDELDLKKEAYILAQLKSPHVVNVLGLVCLRPVAPMGLVMKFYPQSLEDFMRSDDFECLVMVDKVRMSLELAEGLFSLHDHPWKAIVHGDLKPSNVQVEQCLGGQWVCAIGDFGSAAISSTTRSFNTVNIAASGASSSFTWLYAAPEVVISNKKRPEADVYSLGLIIAQIFTGQEPYDGEPVVERVISWVKEKRPPMIVDPDPEVMPTAVHMLILGCLDQRPDLRPSAQQIVEVLGQLHRPGVTTLAASPPVSLDTLSPRPVHAPQVQPISFHVRKLGSSCFPAEQLDAAAALHILAAANDENTIKIKAAEKKATIEAVARREAAIERKSAMMKAAADKAAADKAAADRVAADKAIAGRVAACKAAADRVAADMAADKASEPSYTS